jgi:hypothetical protein
VMMRFLESCPADSRFPANAPLQLWAAKRTLTILRTVSETLIGREDVERCRHLDLQDGRDDTKFQEFCPTMAQQFETLRLQVVVPSQWYQAIPGQQAGSSG